MAIGADGGRLPHGKARFVAWVYLVVAKALSQSQGLIARSHGFCTYQTAACGLVDEGKEEKEVMCEEGKYAELR